MTHFPMRAAGALVALLSASAVSATSLSITVTNNQGDGGFAITPLYTAFHNGSFDAFDVGAPASEGLETIAEFGRAGPATDITTIASERVAVDPGSVGGVVNTSDGPPPIQPGETASITIDVDPSSNIFFTFLAMLLPSNDTFIGNDSATAYRIFDDMGGFLGPVTIDVTGEDVYDAGTELNALLGSAFVQGEDITLGGEEGGFVTRGSDLSAFAGATLGDGSVFDSAFLDLLGNNPAELNLLTIEIDVAPIPVPASAPLLIAGLGFGAFVLGKKRSQK